MKTKKKAVKETLTVRITPAKRRKLDRLATARKVDRSAVISEALDQYLAFELWQIERIKEGLRQADAGELVSQDEVAAWVDSWGDRDELPLPEIR